MGVLQNIYCFTKEPIELDLLGQFAELQKGNPLLSDFLMGPAIDPVLESSLISPDFTKYHPDLFKSFGTIQDALKGLISSGVGLLSVNMHTSYCHASEGFYDFASLGIYLLPCGHNLVIGKPEDFPLDGDTSDLQPDTPIFDDEVFWCLWIQGKNAPTVDDFLGSSIHKQISSIWPNVIILDDTWL